PIIRPALQPMKIKGKLDIPKLSFLLNSISSISKLMYILARIPPPCYLTSLDFLRFPQPLLFLSSSSSLFFFYVSLLFLPKTSFSTLACSLAAAIFSPREFDTSVTNLFWREEIRFREEHRDPVRLKGKDILGVIPKIQSCPSSSDKVSPSFHPLLAFSQDLPPISGLSVTSSSSQPHVTFSAKKSVSLKSVFGSNTTVECLYVCDCEICEDDEIVGRRRRGRRRGDKKKASKRQKESSIMYVVGPSPISIGIEHVLNSSNKEGMLGCYCDDIQSLMLFVPKFDSLVTVDLVTMRCRVLDWTPRLKKIRRDVGARSARTRDSEHPEQGKQPSKGMLLEKLILCDISDEEEEEPSFDDDFDDHLPPIGSQHPKRKKRRHSPHQKYLQPVYLGGGDLLLVSRSMFITTSISSIKKKMKVAIKGATLRPSGLCFLKSKGIIVCATTMFSICVYNVFSGVWCLIDISKGIVDERLRTSSVVSVCRTPLDSSHVLLSIGNIWCVFDALSCVVTPIATPEGVEFSLFGFFSHSRNNSMLLRKRETIQEEGKGKGIEIKSYSYYSILPKEETIQNKKKKEEEEEYDDIPFPIEDEEAIYLNLERLSSLNGLPLEEHVVIPPCPPMANMIIGEIVEYESYESDESSGKKHHYSDSEEGSWRSPKSMSEGASGFIDHDSNHFEQISRSQQVVLLGVELCGLAEDEKQRSLGSLSHFDLHHSDSNPPNKQLYSRYNSVIDRSRRGYTPFISSSVEIEEYESYESDESSGKKHHYSDSEEGSWRSPKSMSEGASGFIDHDSNHFEQISRSQQVVLLGVELCGLAEDEKQRSLGSLSHFDLHHSDSNPPNKQLYSRYNSVIDRSRRGYTPFISSSVEIEEYESYESDESSGKKHHYSDSEEGSWRSPKSMSEGASGFIDHDSNHFEQISRSQQVVLLGVELCGLAEDEKQRSLGSLSHFDLHHSDSNPPNKQLYSRYNSVIDRSRRGYTPFISSSVEIEEGLRDLVTFSSSLRDNVQKMAKSSTTSQVTPTGLESQLSTSHSTLIQSSLMSIQKDIQDMQHFARELSDPSVSEPFDLSSSTFDISSPFSFGGEDDRSFHLPLPFDLSVLLSKLCLVACSLSSLLHSVPWDKTVDSNVDTFIVAFQHICTSLSSSVKSLGVTCVMNGRSEMEEEEIEKKECESQTFAVASCEQGTQIDISGSDIPSLKPMSVSNRIKKVKKARANVIELKQLREKVQQLSSENSFYKSRLKQLELRVQGNNRDRTFAESSISSHETQSSSVYDSLHRDGLCPIGSPEGQGYDPGPIKLISEYGADEEEEGDESTPIVLSLVHLKTMIREILRRRNGVQEKREHSAKKSKESPRPLSSSPLQAIPKSPTRSDSSIFLHQIPLSSFLISWFNRKYGVRKIIVRWIRAFYSAIESFQHTDLDVKVFKMVLDGHLDEGFIPKRDKLIELVGIHMDRNVRNSNPLIRKKDLDVKILKIFEGKEKISKKLCLDIIKAVFNKSDQKGVMGELKSYTQTFSSKNVEDGELELESSPIPSRFLSHGYSPSKYGHSFSLYFEQFCHVLSQYFLSSHLRTLSSFSMLWDKWMKLEYKSTHSSTSRASLPEIVPYGLDEDKMRMSWASFSQCLKDGGISLKNCLKGQQLWSGGQIISLNGEVPGEIGHLLISFSDAVKIIGKDISKIRL
ncbi:hypothetical protein ADUPG1_006874, partial [Aduncisulcus paluster]